MKLSNHSDEQAEPGNADVQTVVRQVIEEFLKAERSKAEPAYKAELVEERKRRESLEARLFSRAEIPWQQLAFRSTREALEDYYTGTVHPVR